VGKIWRSPADMEYESAEDGLAGGANTSKVILQTLGLLFGAAALLVLVGTWLNNFEDHPVTPRPIASTTSTPTSPPPARTATSAATDTSSTTQPSSTIDEPSAKKTVPPTPPATLPATPSGSGTPSEAAAAGASSGPATPTAQQAPASFVVPETAPTSWTVRPGDDLWSIAGEVLGGTVGGTDDLDATTAYWRTLVAANAGVLADPNLLHPGQVHTLPAAAASPGPQTPPAPPPASARPAASTPATTWTVQSGDDLWSIAQAVVGGTSGLTTSIADTTAYWRTLVAANSSIVADPNLLFAGQILTLPPLRD
jgi:nucleoid-associated protein YgaU